MAEQGSLEQAWEVLGDMFDSISPYRQSLLKRLQKDNEKFKRFPHLFPKFIIDDSSVKPTIVNLDEKYPDVKYFQFGFQRGYTYIFSDKGYPLMMAEHGCFYKLEDAKAQLDHLINVIRKGRYIDD